MPTDFVEAGPFLEKLVGPLTFGMFVRAARTRLDITQAEAARRLGVSRAMLCDIEKERQPVSVELARKIAKRLGDSEALAVECCLNDQLRKAKMRNWSVRLEEKRSIKKAS